MAQYDPIAVKVTGIPSVLSTDTMRADLAAVAGFTTAAPVAGDLCQMNGALTVQKALYTSSAPVIGVYDGVSGSIIRAGVVVVNLDSGVVLANGDPVYLSQTAGAITNTKPTNDMLHEIGVVVDSATSKVLLQIKPVVVLPATMLMMNARSSWLLQGDTPPTRSGEQQPFPTTAASLITALGSPGGVTTSNILAIYQCNTASPLVDSLGLGPNLVATGGVLTNRECIGLGQAGSFTSKVGAEGLPGGANHFVENPFSSFAFPPDGSIRTFMLVVRAAPSLAAGPPDLCGNIGGATANWWICRINNTPPQIDIVTSIAGGGPGVAAPDTGAWFPVVVVLQSNGTQVRTRGLTNLADSGWTAYAAGSLVDATGLFCLFGRNGVNSVPVQCAYLAAANVEITAAMLASFWRAFNLNEFSTPVSYTRAGPLVAPITASRVAAYGANQPAVGFNSNFSGSDNLLKSGTVCEDAITFEAIGSDDLPGNTTNSGGNLHSTVDGPSGMRDAMRITQGGVWPAGAGPFCYIPPVGCAIVGVSNIAWWCGGEYKRGTVGTTARLGMAYSGSASGAEYYMALVVDNATPVDWVRGGGTCTPVYSDQTLETPLFGAANNADDCDWAEIFLVKNRFTAPLAWRRVGIAAAASTSTPSLSYTNVGNARYSPAKGSMTLRLAGFSQKERSYVSATTVGDQPRGCCYAPDGHVWVCNANASTITKVRVSDGVVIGTYATGSQPYACCYDPSQAYIWVACYNGGGASVITVLNAATGGFVATYSSGVAGGAIGLCYANGSIWVNNYSASSVTKITAATGAVVGTYAVAGNNRDPVYDGTSIWVPNDNTNNVTQLTEATGAFVRNVATGNGPISACFDGTFLWTGNWNGASVTKINVATGAAIGTYAVPAQPQGICYDGQYVFVNSQGTATVTQVDPATGGVVRYYRGMFAGGSLLVGLCYDGKNLWSVDLNNDSAVKIGYGQTFLAFGPTAPISASYAAGNDAAMVAFDGTNIWITHATGANTVRKLVAATGALVGDYATGTTPIGVCYDATQDAIWTANYFNGGGGNSVSKLRASDGGLVGTYASGGNTPYGICFDVTQNAVWAANLASNTVTKFNAATGAIIGTYATGAGPTGCCYDSAQNAVWICNQGGGAGNTITKLNAASGALIGTYNVGTGPLWCCYDSVNNRVWTTDNTGGTVTVLNATNGANVATLAAVIDTDLRGIAFDGANVWVACGTARTVIKYRAVDWTPIAVYPIGGASRGVAWDGSSVWVAEGTTDNVTKLTETAQGALWLDYAGNVQFNPLLGLAPQLRLRVWNDLAALVSSLNCGSVTSAQHEYVLVWSAARAKLQVLEGGVTLATYSGAAWTPEGLAVAPLYVGSDPTPANAAHCSVALLGITDY